MRLISTRNHTNPEGARFARARARDIREKKRFSPFLNGNRRQQRAPRSTLVEEPEKRHRGEPGHSRATRALLSFIIHLICEGLRESLRAPPQRNAAPSLSPRPEPSAPLASQCVSSSTQAPALSPPWQPRTLRLFESRTSFCETPPQPALMRSLSTVSHRQAELDATPGPG